MITIEIARAAVLSEVPHAKLDELVRAEMAAGRKVKDIFGDLNPIIDDVLDVPGLTEDGEEAFLGTLDALTGMCHRDCWYVDPLEAEPATDNATLLIVRVDDSGVPFEDYTG